MYLNAKKIPNFAHTNIYLVCIQLNFGAEYFICIIFELIGKYSNIKGIQIQKIPSFGVVFHTLFDRPTSRYGKKNLESSSYDGIFAMICGKVAF